MIGALAAFAGIVVINTGAEFGGEDGATVVMLLLVAGFFVTLVLGCGLVNVRRLFGLAPRRRWRGGTRTGLVRRSPGWAELGDDRHLTWRPDDGIGGWSVDVTEATVRRRGAGSTVDVVADDGRTFTFELGSPYRLSPLPERWFPQRSGQQARQFVDAVRAARGR